MFRKSYNRALLTMRVETVTPLLIRAGDSGLDPSAADLTCVRTRHGQRGLTVYIPGSSLKGVLRSAAEASVRGRMFHDGTIHGACDPLEHASSCSGEDKSRKARRDKELASHEVHRKHCLACRTFGSLAMKGRTSVRDLFPWSGPGATADDEATGPAGENWKRANRLEVRHNVAIDRVMGSASTGALFDQEMVPAGIRFWGDIALENYQVWQLGLLAGALDEVNHGIAQLGSSKSRGLGVATIAIESILHEQTGLGARRPCGAGTLATPGERDQYGLVPESELPEAPAEARGLFTRYRVTGEQQIAAWLAAGQAALGGLQ